MLKPLQRMFTPFRRVYKKNGTPETNGLEVVVLYFNDEGGESGPAGMQELAWSRLMFLGDRGGGLEDGAG